MMNYKQGFLLISLICVFICLTILSKRITLFTEKNVYFVNITANTVARENVTTKLACTHNERISVLNAQLSVGRKNGIMIHDKRFRECLTLNSSRIGVYKYMVPQNFEGVVCEKPSKRFLMPGKFPTTMLLSFPGSGNTWTRHLIEEITGFHTGSVSNDSTLRSTFKGEGHTSGVIVVKSHKDWKLDDRLKPEKVIVLLREPFGSILSFFNYINKGHTATMAQDEMERESFKMFAMDTIPMYKRTNLGWFRNFKGRLFVQYYSDMKKDTLNSLTRLSSFLKTNVTLHKLWCVDKVKTGSFKRGAKPLWQSRSNLVDEQLEMSLTSAKKIVYDFAEKRRQTMY